MFGRRQGKLEDETPRAFADWQRRDDPLLAAEETNQLFIAFQRRRELHKLRLVDRMLQSGGQGDLGEAAGDRFKIIGYFVLASILTAGIGYYVMIIPLSFMSLRGRINSSRLPARLMQVFSLKGYLESAAIDIIQSGCSGRDIIEAIYLEGRQQQARAQAWICATFFLAALGFLGYLHLFGRMQAVAVVFLASLGVFLWRLYYVLLDASIGGIASMMLLPRLLHWSAASPFAGYIAHSKAIRGRILLAFARGVLIAGIPIVMILTMAGPGAVDLGFVVRHLPVRLENLQSFLVYTASVMLLVAAATSGLGRARRRERLLERVAFYYTIADEAFEHFVLTVVQGDEDGRRIARERKLGEGVTAQMLKRKWRDR